MGLTVKEPESNFQPCPAGTHHAVCCDVVDLGEVETQWGKKPMVRIVWQVEEQMADLRPFTASQRFTASLHEKARLRGFLESWRGRRLSADELKGFDLERLIGINALLNVVHDEKDGKVYSNIASIMPPPKSSSRLQASPDYVRAKDRKKDGAGGPPEHAEDDFSTDRQPGDDDVW